MVRGAPCCAKALWSYRHPSQPGPSSAVALARTHTILRVPSPKQRSQCVPESVWVRVSSGVVRVNDLPELLLIVVSLRIRVVNERGSEGHTGVGDILGSYGELEYLQPVWLLA